MKEIGYKLQDFQAEKKCFRKQSPSEFIIDILIKFFLILCFSTYNNSKNTL